MALYYQGKELTQLEFKKLLIQKDIRLFGNSKYALLKVCELAGVEFREDQQPAPPPAASVKQQNLFE